MRLVSLVAAGALIAACGASRPVSAPPPAPAATSAVAPPPAAAPVPSAQASAAPPAPEPDAPPAPDTTKSDDTQPRRDKIYRTTPHGLEIEIGGVLLVANAKAVRVGKGWGAELAVTASATDKQDHVLAKPDRGALAVAARVDRGGTQEKIGDKRSGEATLELHAGGKQTLKRRWPSGDDKPLGAGQSAELEVGLWGLGTDKASLYPVRELFAVKLAVTPDNKGSALVSPPASAAQAE